MSQRANGWTSARTAILGTVTTELRPPGRLASLDSVTVILGKYGGFSFLRSRRSGRWSLSSWTSYLDDSRASVQTAPCPSWGSLARPGMARGSCLFVLSCAFSNTFVYDQQIWPQAQLGHGEPRLSCDLSCGMSVNDLWSRGGLRLHAATLCQLALLKPAKKAHLIFTSTLHIHYIYIRSLLTHHALYWRCFPYFFSLFPIKLYLFITYLLLCRFMSYYISLILTIDHLAFHCRFQLVCIPCVSQDLRILVFNLQVLSIVENKTGRSYISTIFGNRNEEDGFKVLTDPQLLLQS